MYFGSGTLPKCDCNYSPIRFPVSPCYDLKSIPSINTNSRNDSAVEGGHVNLIEAVLTAITMHVVKSRKI